MMRAAIIRALQESAAENQSIAREHEYAAGDHRDTFSDDLRGLAAEHRYHAGICIAAVNHLNGVSPVTRFEDLPLSGGTFSPEERARWLEVLSPLVGYAGRPGDWGRESQLGILTMHLLSVRHQLVNVVLEARD